MPPEPNNTLALIESKLADGATGEIIVAGADLEAHIYLQAGRIAWAYNNLERGAFLREIMEVSGLDDEAVREVLQECRTQHKHVAETLLAWGVVQEAQVRRALWNQIAGTLKIVGRMADCEALFLRRRQSLYDDRLTFLLDEFDRASFSNVPPETDDAGLLQREEALQQSLAESNQPLLWVKLLRLGSLSASTSTSIMLGVMAELMAASGATECAYRETVGWLYGLRHPDGYLFCGLRPDALLTKTRSTLQQQMGQPPPPPATPLVLGSMVRMPIPQSLVPLVAMLENIEFLAGIFHCTPEGTVSLLRQGAPADLDERVRQLNVMIGLPLSAVIQPTPQPRATPVSPGVRVVLPGIHLLGSPLGAGSLWLAMCPSVREGFGWVLLTNALRTLNESEQKSLHGKPRPH
jgi:hypothetical protein